MWLVFYFYFFIFLFLICCFPCPKNVTVRHHHVVYPLTLKVKLNKLIVLYIPDQIMHLHT